MNALTTRQAEILAFIHENLETTGMPPTRAEIAAHFGFSSTYAAGKHLQALAKKGVIELLPGASRGIRIVSATPEGLPLIGQVAAGSPMLAEAYIEDYFNVDPALFNPAADYLLRVRDMSMQDIGILDSDLVAVKQLQDAENGQVVVARLEGEVTVKRFRRHKKGITLLPENPDFQPIHIDPGIIDFYIEGVVVGSIRTHY